MLGADWGVCCGSCSWSGVERDWEGGLVGQRSAGLAPARGVIPSRRRVPLMGCSKEVGGEESSDSNGEGAWELGELEQESGSESVWVQAAVGWRSVWVPTVQVPGFGCVDVNLVLV